MVASCSATRQASLSSERMMRTLMPLAVKGASVTSTLTPTRLATFTNSHHVPLPQVGPPSCRIKSALTSTDPSKAATCSQVSRSERCSLVEGELTRQGNAGVRTTWFTW